jgi:hypothetical protein
MINFHIISCGWKCEKELKLCIKSVDSQTYPHWKHTVIEDGVGCVIQQADGKKRIRMACIGRYGKLYNFHLQVGSIPDNDIICDFDIDDYLLPNALETVAEVCEKYPETLITHGSYQMLSGRPARFNGAYKNDNFRGQKFTGTHFKTFRAGLFKKIKVKDFKAPDGHFLMTCADMAMMFPMLEMAGLDRIKFINKPLYIYNDLNDLNDHKVPPAIPGHEQKTLERYLRKKPKYRRINW